MAHLQTPSSESWPGLRKVVNVKGLALCLTHSRPSMRGGCCDQIMKRRLLLCPEPGCEDRWGS